MAETAAEQRSSGDGAVATPELADAAKSRKEGGARVERMAKRFEVKDVDLYYGNFHAVQSVSMTVEPNQVTALIGSSGCGKATVLRSLNRVHGLRPGLVVEGRVVLDDEDIGGPISV